MIRRKLRNMVSAGLYTLCAYLEMKAQMNIKHAKDDLEDAEEQAHITTLVTRLVRSRLDRDLPSANDEPESTLH